MVTVISAIIIAVIATSLVFNNIKIENIYEIEDNIVHFLTSRPHGIEDPSYKNAIRDIAVNHSENMQTLNRIIKYNKTLLIALLAFIAVQGVILYMLIIKMTHRISGPLYVMSMYMRDIINGKIPNPRPLRKKDELKEFYEVFREMVKSIKQ
jgi:nitrogen fixation/metabolism regulation signal transduction histidine kinase